MAFAAGQKLTAALLNAEFNKDRVAYMSGDQSRISSTVLTNATGLVLSVEANSWYALESLIIFDTNATADFKWNFSLPSGSFIRQASWGSSAGAINSPIFHDAYDAATNALGGVAAGTMMTMRPSGIIITSTTAGNCQFQFAQNTSTAVSTILKGGSWMRLVKVA